MEQDQSRDFQQLLPADMRSRWAVVPRFALYQMVVVGVLLGAGAALSVVGFVYGHGWMRWAFPVALVAAWVQNKLLGGHERRVVSSAADSSR